MDAPELRRPQPWPIRFTHWANVPLLVVMAGSGLQILLAFPSLGPIGDPAGWYPLHGKPPPEALRIGEWLAGGRHWHFAFMWLLVGNAAVYLSYLFARGEWRRRLFFPRRDTRNALATLGSYLRLRGTPPHPGLYNGLQRLAYTGALAIAVVEVLSGLVLYKPVQLGWLTFLFGGYDSARAIHLLGLAALALFTVGHVAMVALHPRSLLEMITGGKPRE